MLVYAPYYVLKSGGQSATNPEWYYSSEFSPCGYSASPPFNPNLLPMARSCTDFPGVGQVSHVQDSPCNNVGPCTDTGDKSPDGKILGVKSGPLGDSTENFLNQKGSGNFKQDSAGNHSSFNKPVNDKKQSGEANHFEEDPSRCKDILAEIESKGCVSHLLVLEILPNAVSLATSKHGCRVMQKVIHEAGGDDRTLIVNQFHGRCEELYKCPCGNHVLMKIIEVMPPANLGFLVAELSGKTVALAKHQYGCRILERLIEHFPAGQIANLVAELLEAAESLCRHQFGNFVMQHLFEHGSEECKAALVEQIRDFFPALAKHRAASHVVQSALKYSNAEVQGEIASALLNAKGDCSLVEVAASRYGSYVVRELAGIQTDHYKDLRNVLEEALPKLLQSEGEKFSKRPLAAFDLLPATEEKVAGSK